MDFFFVFYKKSVVCQFYVSHVKEHKTDCKNIQDIVI